MDRQANEMGVLMPEGKRGSHDPGRGRETIEKATTGEVVAVVRSSGIFPAGCRRNMEEVFLTNHAACNTAAEFLDLFPNVAQESIG